MRLGVAENQYREARKYANDASTATPIVETQSFFFMISTRTRVAPNVRRQRARTESQV